MKDKPRLQHRFEAQRCCVLIPTYNNKKTLERVISEVLTYTTNVIIVNDGSTDGTAAILNGFKNLEVISLQQNKGKGNALKIGFKEAMARGYEYTITMDSDGQHFPDDLEVFLEALEEKSTHDEEPLVIGSRKMDDPSVPDKSSLGNRCSTFWFWVETGIKLTDTQCGYRLYPLKVVDELNLYTSKFELEIEVIVKAAWEGARVENRPVKVLYDPLERVTHFRPFQDVTRITLLNIWFVMVLVSFIIPRELFRKFQQRKEEVSVKTNLTVSSFFKKDG